MQKNKKHFSIQRNASIGTVHGMYDSEPNIRLDLLAQIKEKVDIPLVLHGGSGTPANQVLLAIIKINNIFKTLILVLGELCYFGE